MQAMIESLEANQRAAGEDHESDAIQDAKNVLTKYTNLRAAVRMRLSHAAAARKSKRLTEVDRSEDEMLGLELVDIEQGQTGSESMRERVRSRARQRKVHRQQLVEGELAVAERVCLQEMDQAMHVQEQLELKQKCQSAVRMSAIRNGRGDAEALVSAFNDKQEAAASRLAEHQRATDQALHERLRSLKKRRMEQSVAASGDALSAASANVRNVLARSPCNVCG